MQTPFQLLGEEKIHQLARAFYHAMETLPEAAGIRAMHAKDLGPISDTLAEYLMGWMGGPPRYHERKGTVCLTDPHAAYHIGPDETEQWLLCFDAALDAINASDDVKKCCTPQSGKWLPQCKTEIIRTRPSKTQISSRLAESSHK